MISVQTQAETVRERISAVLTTMQEMDANKDREAARLLGAAGEDAEQALLLIEKIRGEL